MPALVLNRMRCLAHNGRWSKTNASRPVDTDSAKRSSSSSRRVTKTIARLGSESKARCYICLCDNNVLYHVVPLNGRSVDSEVDRRMNVRTQTPAQSSDEFWEPLTTNASRSAPVYSLVDTERVRDPAFLRFVLSKLVELDKEGFKYKNATPEDLLRDNVFCNPQGDVVLVNKHTLVRSDKTTYNTTVFAKKLVRALFPSVNQKFIAAEVPQWARDLFPPTATSVASTAPRSSRQHRPTPQPASLTLSL